MGNALVWLRDDLRLADNPALNAAVEHATVTGGRVVVAYILDEQSPGIRPLGSASKWWLHHSLSNLAARIRRLGGTLVLRNGAAIDVMRSLLRESDADAVFWNRRYGGTERALDADIKSFATAAGVTAHSFQANLLFEPWTVRTGSGTPYTVFTPFWKNCLAKPEPIRAPLSAPADLRGAGGESIASDALEDWRLLPTQPDWSIGLSLRWQPGEQSAHEKLTHFIDHRIDRYASGRDFPGDSNTSELSPYLRFGEISPVQIFHAVDHILIGRVGPDDLLEGIRRFKAEIGWREFSYHLLFHWPDLARVNFDSRFDHVEWNDAEDGRLERWQQGTTGVPLVDAGMRELWQTGYMHNRVRMVTASFLIKNLLVDWRIGEAWFWDTLVDADPANNAASWQWVAGCGADAAPYFRVFNPLLQAEKFDPDKRYRERYLGSYEIDPEYPAPLVDLAQSRTTALEAFAGVSGRSKVVRPPASFVP